MGDINAIFKSYDIRGLYPQEIDEEVCINVGYALAKFLLEEDPQTTKIIVGVDMRLFRKAFRISSSREYFCWSRCHPSRFKFDGYALLRLGFTWGTRQFYCLT